MSSNIKNILVVVAGLLVGGYLNILLLGLNGTLIPLPDGADISSQEGLSKSIALFEPIHFMAPFLAHAGGTFIAAWIIARFAATPSFVRAMLPGFAFLMGGIKLVMEFDAPLWFEATDLILAYIPMAYIGFRIGTGTVTRKTVQ